MIWWVVTRQLLTQIAQKKFLLFFSFYGLKRGQIKSLDVFNWRFEYISSFKWTLDDNITLGPVFAYGYDMRCTTWGLIKGNDIVCKQHNTWCLHRACLFKYFILFAQKIVLLVWFCFSPYYLPLSTQINQKDFKICHLQLLFHRGQMGIVSTSSILKCEISYWKNVIVRASDMRTRCDELVINCLPFLRKANKDKLEAPPNSLIHTQI